MQVPAEAVELVEAHYHGALFVGVGVVAFFFVEDRLFEVGPNYPDDDWGEMAFGGTER